MQVDEIVVPVRAKADSSDLEKLEKQAKKSTNYLTEIFKNWADGIKKLFQNAFDFSGYFKNIASKLSNLIDFDFIMTGIQKLKGAISTVTSNIADGFKDATSAFQGMLKNIRSMLKDTGKLIGEQLAHDLKTPLAQVVAWFKKNQKAIKKAFQQIAHGIAHTLSAFARGLVQIVQIGKTFINWFNGLPQAIKGATYAVLALWAVLKAGPIGVLSTIVTMVGALSADYQVYKNNIENNKNDDVALPGIWSLIYTGTKQQQGGAQEKGTGDKVKQIAGKIFKKVATGLTEWINANGDSIIQVGTDIIDAIANAITYAGDVLAAGTDSENAGIYKEFGQSFGGFFGKLIGLALTGVGDIGGAIVSAITTAITGKSTDEWTAALDTPVKDNPFAQAIGAYFSTALLTGNSTAGLITAIATFLYNAFYELDEEGNVTDKIKDLSGQFNNVARIVIQTLIGAFDTVHDLSQLVAGAISRFLQQALTGWATNSNASTDLDISKSAGEGFACIIDAVIGGGLAWVISNHSWPAAIIGSFVGLFSSVISSAINDPQVKNQKGDIDWGKFVQKFMSGSTKLGEDIGNAVLTIINAALQAYQIASQVESSIIQTIIGLVCGLFNIKTPTLTEDQATLIKGGINAIITSALTGNFVGGAFVGFGTILLDAFTKAKDQVLDGALKDKPFQEFTSDDWSALLGLTGKNLLAIGQAFINIFTGAFKAVQDWWNTAKDSPEVKQLQEEIRKIWQGDGQNQGLVNIFSNVWDSVSDAFVNMVRGLWKKIQSPINELAKRIQVALYNSLPESVRSVIWGGNAPRSVINNGDGTFTYAQGGKDPATFSDVQLPQGGLMGGMMLSDYVAKYKDYFHIDTDANGDPQIYPTNGKIVNNFGIGVSKSPQQKQGEEAALQYFKWVLDGSVPGDTGSQNGGKGKKTEGQVAQQNTAANTQSAAKTAGEIKSGQSTTNSYLKTIVDDTAHSGSSGGGSDDGGGDTGGATQGGGNSYGGRITSPSRHLIGQDGTQYVIPITNTNRAVQLIQDMVAQMGGKAKDAVANALGINGNTSTIGASMLAGESVGSVAGGMNVVYNNNVSAPVTINVTSSGSSAQAVANHIYSSAQRALLRTLRTAVG